MRSGITYAALLTAASASAAADYAGSLAARDHVAEHLADLVTRSNLDVLPDASDEYLVGRGYDEEYYMDDLMARDDGDMLYARHPDAEPAFGLNHIGKWMGQAAGAVSGGYKSRSNGKNGKYAKNKGGYGQGQDPSYNSYGGGGDPGDMMMTRSLEDDEGLGEMFYIREAEPEPEFEYYDQYLPYRRSIDDIDFQDELFYAREAEAEPEPVLGLNHVSKWTGQAAGSVVGGYKSRSGGKSGGKSDKYGGYSKYERRSAEDDMLYEDDLYIREAEPILGFNTIGKWAGQAAGSVAGGYKSRSAGKGKDKSGKKDKGNKYGGGGGDMMGGGYGGGGGMQQGSLI